MYGVKLTWTGVAMLLAIPLLGGIAGVELAGAIILIIGVILQWLEK